MEFCSARVPTFSRSTSIIAVGFAIDGFAIDGGRRDQRNADWHTAQLKAADGGWHMCRRPQIRQPELRSRPSL